jgi:hypothetical protein
METKHDYTLELNHFGHYFVLKSDGEYTSECFDNRFILWGEIRSLLNQKQLEINNAIELMYGLLNSFLPNFPKDFIPEEGYSELEFLREMYEQLENFQNELMAINLPRLPYLVECVDPEGCAFIFFEVPYEDEESEMYHEHSYLLNSQTQAYDWINKFADEYKIDIMDQELIREQIKNSRMPLSEKFTPINKVNVKSFIYGITPN